jgi:hypothetical protein
MLAHYHVQEALNGWLWISDISGGLSVGVLMDYLVLWDLLQEVELQVGIEDRQVFRLAADGKYSAKLVYESFFIGSNQFEPANIIWKSWAPAKCKFFLWLATHRNCWTVDRLSRRGLDHPEHCPLCDQHQESIDYLLTNCVFAREFWYRLLSQVNLQFLAPQPEGWSFVVWWSLAAGQISGVARRDLNTPIILGAWTLWKHRNRCVFDKKISQH